MDHLMRIPLLALLLIPGGCSGPSQLMRASMQGDAETLDHLLNSPHGSFDLEERDNRGRTVLMVAILESPQDLGIDEVPETVQVLLDHGADVNAREPEGQLTPLRCAILRSYPAVVTALQIRGARVTDRDRSLAKARFDSLLEAYVEHYSWLLTETGQTNPSVLARGREKLHRAERVINHLQTVPSPDLLPIGRDEPQEGTKPKQIQEPVAALPGQ